MYLAFQIKISSIAIPTSNWAVGAGEGEGGRGWERCTFNSREETFCYHFSSKNFYSIHLFRSVVKEAFSS